MARPLLRLRPIGLALRARGEYSAHFSPLPIHSSARSFANQRDTAASSAFAVSNGFFSSLLKQLETEQIVFCLEVGAVEFLGVFE